MGLDVAQEPHPPPSLTLEGGGEKVKGRPPMNVRHGFVSPTGVFLSHATDQATPA